MTESELQNALEAFRQSEWNRKTLGSAKDNATQFERCLHCEWADVLIDRVFCPIIGECWRGRRLPFRIAEEGDESEA